MDFTTMEMQTFISIMRQVAREECLKVLQEKNMEQVFYANIVSANEDGTYSVQIAGTDQIHERIKNKSNTATFAVGDAVVIKAINSNLGNAYIALKCG